MGVLACAELDLGARYLIGPDQSFVSQSLDAVTHDGEANLLLEMHGYTGPCCHAKNVSLFTSFVLDSRAYLCISTPLSS